MIFGRILVNIVGDDQVFAHHDHRSATRDSSGRRVAVGRCGCGTKATRLKVLEDVKDDATCYLLQPDGVGYSSTAGQ